MLECLDRDNFSSVFYSLINMLFQPIRVRVIAELYYKKNVKEKP